MKLLAALLLSALAARSAQLLVLSVDGLDWRYLRDAGKLGLKIPNLRRLMAEGEVAQGVVGVFPTVTWPSHTSLITGVRPDQHGILGNRRPGGGDYYWTTDLLRAPTLWQKAHEKGLKTAAITWPVTVGASIDLNLPEFFLKRNGGSMDLKGIASKASPGLVAKISLAYPSFAREWMDDRGRVLALLWMLEHERPDLILVHLVDLDSEAHDNGPFTPEANATLEYTDEWIGQILRILPSQYVFALVSDHGFERVDKALDLKALNPPGDLQVMGFLAATKDPGVAGWLKQQPGVGRQIPDPELARHAPRFAGSYVFEPAEHVIFGAKIFEVGTHGYFPTRPDYRSVFVLRGPGIAHSTTPETNMLDISPRLEGILFSPAARVK